MHCYIRGLGAFIGYLPIFALAFALLSRAGFWSGIFHPTASGPVLPMPYAARISRRRKGTCLCATTWLNRSVYKQSCYTSTPRRHAQALLLKYA